MATYIVAHEFLVSDFCTSATAFSSFLSAVNIHMHFHQEISEFRHKVRMVTRSVKASKT